MTKPGDGQELGCEHEWSVIVSVEGVGGVIGCVEQEKRQSRIKRRGRTGVSKIQFKWTDTVGGRGEWRW